jgi:hypothetical protein
MTTASRGYGREHRMMRKFLLASYVPGKTLCWRCQRPISDPPSKVHLGHDDADRTIWRGLEHRRCNIGASNRPNPPRRPRW